MRVRTLAIAVVFFGIACAGSLHAQQHGAAHPPAPQRTMLQQLDIPGSNSEPMIGVSEIVPNGSVRRESHPGPEAGYVLQGSGTLLVEGQPPLPLKDGQSYKLASGAAHEWRAGAGGLKLLVT